ncbi:reductase [Boothiomyces macroporosus]|uniref:Reductase n=1 Tax=Boothiomyces macroporosus TaxID=261099 RepID=A0AAD5Y808_9FUNG|nr:reductase [Boothiomyces macroporosus]KAJ3315170.1 reductase [Boothiomyces sp. JEL0838]
MQKIAVVSGASRGIGYAIAKRLSQDGYHIIAISKDAAKLDMKLKDFSSATGIAFDLSKVREIPSLVEQIRKIEEESKIPVSLLVNSAGITHSKLLNSTTLESIEGLFNVNLTAAMLLSQGVLKNMMRNKQGSIINIASVIGNIKGSPGLSAYSASKAGIVGFTRSLAKEVAKKNITVNAIAPGFIDTDMTSNLDHSAIVSYIPQGKLGKPEDVAEAAAYLAKAPYVTGQCLVVDGGLSL